MNKKELLKEIMELPKVETINPISTMSGINVDDLMSAIDRLNKIPDYNDLLKENQELKKQLENYKKLGFKHLVDKNNNLEAQQKEFIKWLEDYLNLFDYRDIEEQAGYDMLEEILQKYREIIGENDV